MTVKLEAEGPYRDSARGPYRTPARMGVVKRMSRGTKARIAVVCGWLGTFAVTQLGWLAPGTWAQEVAFGVAATAGALVGFVALVAAMVATFCALAGEFDEEDERGQK